MYENITKKYKNIIVFDGTCNFCSASNIFVYKRDNNAIFKFASAQSSVGQYLLQSFNEHLDYNKSIVYIKNGIPYTKSTAILKIAASLSWPWRLTFIFKLVPRFIRDVCYDLVAKNRYLINGQSKECIIPTDDFKSRFI